MLLLTYSVVYFFFCFIILCDSEISSDKLIFFLWEHSWGLISAFLEYFCVNRNYSIKKKNLTKKMEYNSQFIKWLRFLYNLKVRWNIIKGLKDYVLSVILIKSKLLFFFFDIKLILLGCRILLGIIHQINLLLIFFLLISLNNCFKIKWKND